MEEQSEQEIKDYELFEYAIDNFILEIDALAESLPLVIGMVELKLKSHSKRLDKFINAHKGEDKNGEETFKIPLDKFNEFNNINKELKSANAAYSILPRNFVVSLVSQYDAYLGELYRALFQIKPELAFLLEKEFSFQDILKYQDLDELKDFVIEKDIENLLRKSHFEQLTTLESRIKKHTGKEFTLTSNLPVLPVFIEVTERRNLFVHCNGIISRNYLENCSKHKVPNISKLQIGNQLDVEPEYFAQAFQAIFEIGVKLGQVLWRKFLPNNSEQADININNLCFDLIQSGYYDLAFVLLKFVSEEIPSKSTAKLKKTIIINKALACYLLDDKKKCNRILKSEDWSIGIHFQLAVAVLKENFDEATKLMIKIGPNDEDFDASNYQEWPLFNRFRDTDEFKKTFKEIFDKEFVIKKAPEKSFVKLLSGIEERKKNLEEKKESKS